MFAPALCFAQTSGPTPCRKRPPPPSVPVLPNCAVGGLLPGGRHRPGRSRISVVRIAHGRVGVLPAPLRNVVITAMEIATLEAMFPGRLRVGIGHGVQDWMRQAGAAVASPLTLMREYVSALSDLLAGQSVTVDGRYLRLADVRLD